jgi:DNA-binding transcriptional MerR regulator
MRIGELAKQAGVSVQTLRFYERRRLIRTPRRTAAGYRLYTEGDLEILRLIKRMQRYGFTLKEARRILQLFALPSDAGEDSPYGHGSHECLREVVDIGGQKLTALNQQIQDLTEIRDELENELRQFRRRLAPPKKTASRDAQGNIEIRRRG